mgnify:CR=1 FL=1
MNTTESHLNLLVGVLDSLESPPKDEQLRALALLVGSTMLVAALDLIDQNQGTTHA